MSEQLDQGREEPIASRGWRLAGLVASGVLALFALSAIFGFLVAHAEAGGGSLKPAGFGFLAIASVLAVLLGGAAWRLSAPWRGPGRSAYDRRYTRTWVILLALGLPVGIMLGILTDAGSDSPGDLFGTGPIEPMAAVIATAILLVVLVVTAILYHRAIDDHEEQAYLWSTTGAFYALAAMLPTAWLLERGGLVGPLGLGTAMLLLLAATLIQCLIWFWLKFR
jgi:hypothetical protein